jgi:hypothetical protein
VTKRKTAVKEVEKRFVTDPKVLVREIKKAAESADKRSRMLQEANCVSQELLRLEVSM